MKKIVLFLHGYGSNGNDLISLKDHISVTKPVEFISPNAPEPCELNFFGYQWFALNERSFEELTMGLSSAFNYLDDIINDEDLCPLDPEDYDGDRDLDGCPDP